MYTSAGIDYICSSEHETEFGFVLYPKNEYKPYIICLPHLTRCLHMNGADGCAFIDLVWPVHVWLKCPVWPVHVWLKCPVWPVHVWLKCPVCLQGMLTHWTKKIIVEEGHTMAQLVHILWVTQSSIYYEIEGKVQSHLPPFRNLGNFVHPTFACVFQNRH